MRKLFLLLIPLGLVASLVAGVLVYTKVIADDPPERLTFGDAPTTSVPGATTSPATAATGATGAVDGKWAITPASQAGYRAKEILFGQSVTAVGRTNAVTGDMTIQGTTVSTASFTVDMTKVKSDRNQRDDQFQGRIMNTSQFPTATFVLSSPINVGTLPADKAETTIPAKGKLTLKGRTNDVSFELKARRNGANIEVNGTIPVKFADYGIDNPSGGPAQVGDNGEVEVLLVFAKAA
jgi:polyisoprenoid-binding protein YceI